MPWLSTENKVVVAKAAVEEPIAKAVVFKLAGVSKTESLANGVDVPIPVLPEPSIKNLTRPLFESRIPNELAMLVIPAPTV